MDYIATKPCQFDRLYLIGEIIPGEQVIPGMDSALMKRGQMVAYKDNIAGSGGEGVKDNNGTQTKRRVKEEERGP